MGPYAKSESRSITSATTRALLSQIQIVARGEEGNLLNLEISDSALRRFLNRLEEQREASRQLGKGLRII